MSRSLAPSPIATVCAMVTPSSAANCRSASALRARSTTGPSTRPVSRPSTTSSVFASEWSRPRSATRSSVIAVNPPLTTATAYPRRLRVRTSVRPPGVSRTRPRTASTELTGRPASSATRARSDASKSSSPAIAASVTRATSSRHPASAASISITSPCTRVESTSITTRRRARRHSVAASTAMSMRWATASAASSVLSRAVSPPETSRSYEARGELDSRRMRSMFAPQEASRRATPAKAPGARDGPSTTTWWRPEAGSATASSRAVTSISTPSRAAAAASAVRSARPSP